MMPSVFELVAVILRKPPRRWPRLFWLLGRAVLRDIRFRLRCWRYGFDAHAIRRRVWAERLKGRPAAPE